MRGRDRESPPVFFKKILDRAEERERRGKERVG
jgi:hypothetical protein